MAPLASLAVLLAYQVHQMFPLMAENWRSSQIRSLLEMQGQILKAAATEQGQSVLQGKEIQSSSSTCSGTTKKFWVPDHGSRTATMAKFRAFLRNPDLFRTIFLTFPDF